MLASAQKTAVASLDALRHKINLQILATLQPLFLLQMAGGLSQAVTRSISQTQVLARTLLLNGQQRLRALLAVTPSLRWPLTPAPASDRSEDADSTPEEAAAQALLEVCLGLILEWMARRVHRPRFQAPPPYSRQHFSPSHLPLTLYLLRARLCISVPLV